MPTPRQARGAAVLAVLLLCAGLPAAPASAQVQWRSGRGAALPSLSPAAAATGLRTMVQPDQRRHVIVRFADRVGADTRRRMEAGGVKLLSYLGDNTFFAVVNEPQLNEAALARVRSFRSAAAIEPGVKLHPRLAAGEVPDGAVTGQVHLAGAAGPEPVVGVYVILHPDVTLDEGVALALLHGAVVRDQLESLNGLVLELPFSAINLLARADAVQWIEPPLPRLSEVNDSNRQITQADNVQAPPDNLDGTGVTVLVYDGGTARETHVDLDDHILVLDGSGMSDHATHTCGTVGGDGTASGGTYRGMAPGVFLLSYGFEYDGSGIFLYSNPGDMEDDYSEAISTYGADVSNNSIGSNVSINGFPCDITGDYGVTAALIDTIVRGDGSNPLFDDPFRIVWSAGNERQSSNCGDTYFTMAPPANAKNHITVGALNSNDDSVTSFTSWGPSDDGRLKPDISGPGCQSNDDGGVTSTSSNGDDQYVVKCGTSMSGPTVCGLTALLLEDYRAEYPASPDPTNATVKALLCNTAQDIENAGPDFMTGYGSVRIENAINLMRSGAFTEGSVDQGEARLYSVQIDPGDELKVTLAWDDVPATPNTNFALINDLDLLVFGPGGTAFPWTLDPANPADPAVQTQPDHVNNIEQVYIADPAPGLWTVQVTGYDVPQGPQPFSLAGAGTPGTGIFFSVQGGIPEIIPPETVTTIDVLIDAVGESIVGGSPTLHYRTAPGAFTDTPLAPQGGGVYQATLPAKACADDPEYYFSAEGTTSGVVNNPYDAPTSLYTSLVGTIETIFTDDFDTDQGWTAENLGATSGDWQRGVPVNDPDWDYDPAADGDGSGQCYLTQNEIGNTDVDDGAVRLTSPALDMSGTDRVLSYEYYLRLTNTDGAVDRLLVEMSSNGDAGPWIVVATHATDGGSVWRHHEITGAEIQAAGLTLTSTMKARFTANDADPQSIVEAGIDGVTVSGFTCAGGVCGDGTADPGEDCANCPEDVPCAPDEECVGGVCLPLCGNGTVDPGEDCATCPADVPCGPDEECVGGVCMPLCGNGVVDPGEDCANCPEDVPCAPDEECVGGVCVPLCGNGTVDPGEDCTTCPQDVPCPPGTECINGACEPLCGNGTVDPGEDCANCPADVPCAPDEECVAGVCEPLCGNGVPDPGEDCANCPADVPCPPGTMCVNGVCEPFCGNGTVDPGEDCSNCPADVVCPPGTECIDGACVELCGNGTIDPGEDCSNCPADVVCPPGTECVDGICEDLCGNGTVDPGEDCETCPEDVPCPPGTECINGICEPLCGNGAVDPGEDCANCPADVPCGPDEECVDGVCLPLCGNGVVNPGEDCTTCPEDVPCPTGTECIDGVCEPLCGNGTVDPGEDCANCPADVVCPPGTECVNGVCEELCGNGTVDPGEDCANCPADVVCPPGTECVGGACVATCPWDLDDSGDVGVTDFLELLAQWGTDPGGPPDFDGDGNVGVNDFLELLANWGDCAG
jgi:hypothetical protein